MEPADILAAYTSSFDDDPGPPEPPTGAHTAPETAAPALTRLLLSRSALTSLPDPEPLIDNVLDHGTVGLLYGMWGSGKSFIAQDWAASTATGRSWQNRPTEQTRTLYIAAEGAFGLKARLSAWEIGWQTTIPDGSLDILPRPVNLTHYAETNELAALIDWNGYGLVVIDTLARCMVGADENSARDCGQVVDALTRLRERTPSGRGVIIAVHHSGKDGKTFRGSSAFEAGADTVYSVTRDGDDGSIILNREKRKDGPQHDTHTLKLDPIPGSGSCAISVSSPVRHQHRADALLSHFQSHFAATGATATQLSETCELSRATFFRALNDLTKRGDLINTGTDARPFYKLTNP
ncbi:AAA domain-containing protein [Mycobacterium sp. BK086]|uniref:AAA family ATPase n=1 Tax=Mycobacterium sp. BK086 TaxID=2512165 RepID=UPI0010EB6B5E|nr:AAA family ATPase [Mycobacterium sp. BK086]TDO16930.1 AAA domain-containing protein [Mycobacterium sp. BK086]